MAGPLPVWPHQSHGPGPQGGCSPSLVSPRLLPFWLSPSHPQVGWVTCAQWLCGGCPPTPGMGTRPQGLRKPWLLCQMGPGVRHPPHLYRLCSSPGPLRTLGEPLPPPSPPLQLAPGRWPVLAARPPARRQKTLRAGCTGPESYPLPSHSHCRSTTISVGKTSTSLWGARSRLRALPCSWTRTMA